MMKSFGAGLVVSGVLVLAACGGEAGHDQHVVINGEEVVMTAEELENAARADGPLVRYANPYGDGRDNPIADGATAKVQAVRTASGKTVVTLQVFGAAPNRHFGSHVHVSGCDVNKGSGHYQNEVAPAGLAADPRWANPQNEVWLDLVTDAEGNGSAQAVANYHFRENGANAIILHDQHTNHSNGTAGAKLGCLDVDF